MELDSYFAYRGCTGRRSQAASRVFNPCRPDCRRMREVRRSAGQRLAGLAGVLPASKLAPFVCAVSQWSRFNLCAGSTEAVCANAAGALGAREAAHIPRAGPAFRAVIAPLS